MMMLMRILSGTVTIIGPLVHATADVLTNSKFNSLVELSFDRVPKHFAGALRYSNRNRYN